MKRWFVSTGIVVAATVGSGIFALPYVIQRAGWLLSFGYFIILIAVVSLAHILYFRTLDANGGKKRLFGLAEEYFGRTGFWAAFFSIVIGLLLGFVGYLILGQQFIHTLIPGVPPLAALGFFWFVLSLLVFFSEGDIGPLETIGVLLLFGVVLFIFFSSHPLHLALSVPLVNAKDFFLPFGAVLFSLAGWTSVEPVFGIEGQFRGTARRYLVFVAGAAFAAMIYGLFSFGVLNSSPVVTPDTISGILSWPLWRRDTLALVGLIAIGVVAVPLSREIRGILERNLRLGPLLSRSIIMVAPLIVVLLGFNNFFVVVSLAGGVFLSMQYILIVSVGRRALRLARREKVLLDVFVGIFICFAVYEIAGFIVH
jgi:amino acid permease